MAAGDIIAAVVNVGGYSLSVTFEGMSPAGTYATGIGTNNDPTNLKIVLAVTSEGYDNACNLGTKSRTVYGVPCQNPNLGAMRKADPNETSPDETVSGSDLVVVFALSEFIYNDDTNITVDIAAGLYNDGAVSSALVNDLAVTNNSTLDYPRAVGQWAIAQRQTIVGTTIHVEFIVFQKFGENGKPLACVKFTATDDHSNSVTTTVTDMIISADSPCGKILDYQADLDVSSMTDGDTPIVRAQCYPWIGDADSVLDTNDGVNTFPTPLYTNLEFRLDKVGVHGHTCVSSGGNNSTGTVYSSRSAAEAGNHFLAIEAALTALQSYNNTNAGHNDAGGGKIYLGEGTWTLNSSNGGTLTHWVTITRMSTALRANTIFQAAANNSAFPTFMKLSGLTYNGSTYFYGNNTRYLWVHDCAVSTTGALTVYYTHYSVATNNSGYFANRFKVYSTYRTQWALIRGNDLSSRHETYGYCVLGNNNVYIMAIASATNLMNDGGIFAYNKNMSSDTTLQVAVAGTYNISHGFAIVQNIFERISSAVEAMMAISADASVTTTNNIILWYNTIAGARCNMGYNDIAAGGPYPQVNWSEKGNLYSNYNNKDDVFGGNPDAIGGWPVGYHVGSSGNFFRASVDNAWFGEFYGLWIQKGTTAVPYNPEYIDDNSYDGSNDGNGNYHLLAASAAATLSKDALLPYDYSGAERKTPGSVGALEYGSGNSYYYMGNQ